MEHPLAPPEPPLSDGVIVLRPWRREDAPVLASVFGSADADLAYWMDEVPQPYSLAHAVAYVGRSQAGWRGEVPATPFAICAWLPPGRLGILASRAWNCGSTPGMSRRGGSWLGGERSQRGKGR